MAPVVPSLTLLLIRSILIGAGSLGDFVTKHVGYYIRVHPVYASGMAKHKDPAQSTNGRTIPTHPSLTLLSLSLGQILLLVDNGRFDVFAVNRIVFPKNGEEVNS